MPRKVASSTMFVKNVRNTTVLPNQRMQASSKNNMRKLTRNKSAYARDGRERRLIRNTRGDCRSRERFVNTPGDANGALRGHDIRSTRDVRAIELRVVVVDEILERGVQEQGPAALVLHLPIRLIASIFEDPLGLIGGRPTSLDVGGQRRVKRRTDRDVQTNGCPEADLSYRTSMKLPAGAGMNLAKNLPMDLGMDLAMNQVE